MVSTDEETPSLWGVGRGGVGVGGFGKGEKGVKKGRVEEGGGAGMEGWRDALCVRLCGCCHG